MPKVYILQPPDYLRVKVGYSTQTFKGLFNRYITAFGSDIKFFVFETDTPREIEKQFRKHFINKCVTNELYQAEYLEEYKKFFKKVTGKNPIMLNRETLDNISHTQNIDIESDSEPESEPESEHESDTNDKKYKENKFFCERCYYESNHRNNFMKHLTRVVPCEPRYSQRSIQDIIDKIKTSERGVLQRTFYCNMCDKAFTKGSSLSRHKKEHKNIQAEIPKLDNQHPETNVSNIVQENQNCPITTNTNSNNTTNNYNIQNLTINVLPFGEETTAHVEKDPELITKCLKSLSTDGITKIVEEIFFNETEQQNNNVKMGRERSPATFQVCVLQEDGTLNWKHKPRNEILDAMIDKGCSVLVQYNDLLCRIDTLTQEEIEIVKARKDKFEAITNKKRGVYIPIRDDVYCTVKNAAPK